MAEPVKYNLVKIRELIIEAFDDDELTIFCHDHFRAFADSVSSDTGRKKKAFLLVEYCGRCEKLQVLADRIKAEKHEKYEKYEPQITSSDSAPASRLEEFQAGTSGYGDMFESTSSALSVQHAPAESPPEQENTHPLAGGPQEVKRWFVTDLKPEEQVFVVAAALFSGLERRELMEVYKGLLGVLKPTEPLKHEEAQHG